MNANNVYSLFTMMLLMFALGATTGPEEWMQTKKLTKPILDEQANLFLQAQRVNCCEQSDPQWQICDITSQLA